jgi:hypothetical protein
MGENQRLCRIERIKMTSDSCVPSFFFTGILPEECIQERKYDLSLNEDEMDKLLRLLGRFAYEEVNDLIGNIKTQKQNQDEDED